MVLTSLTLSTTPSLFSVVLRKAMVTARPVEGLGICQRPGVVVDDRIVRDSSPERSWNAIPPISPRDSGVVCSPPDELFPEELPFEELPLESSPDEDSLSRRRAS